MSSLRVNKLQDFFQRKILKEKCTRLTAPGENYGSLMLKIDLTLETPDGVTESCVVAKTLPPDVDTRKLFNTDLTFRNEIIFYKEIIPLFQEFQKENGLTQVINFFPKYRGSRLNLNNENSEVDSDALLLLENLKINGYENLERTAGVEEEVAKCVLENLAHLHGVALAFKLQKQDDFDKKIAPFLSPWKCNIRLHEKTKQCLENTIEGIPELIPFRTRILEGFDKKLHPWRNRETFETVIHNDCWVNNVMVKFGPTETKMVDFQECALSSLAKDVLFFLFSSVANDTITTRFNDLIRFYFGNFTSILQRLGCVPKFDFEDFEKELDFEAKHSQFGHLIFMLYPIFAKNENLQQSSPEHLLELQPTDLHKMKLRFIVGEFMKRNWI